MLQGGSKTTAEGAMPIAQKRVNPDNQYRELEATPERSRVKLLGVRRWIRVHERMRLDCTSDPGRPLSGRRSSRASEEAACRYEEYALDIIA